MSTIEQLTHQYLDAATPEVRERIISRVKAGFPMCHSSIVREDGARCFIGLAIPDDYEDIEIGWLHETQYGFHDLFPGRVQHKIYWWDGKVLENGLDAAVEELRNAVESYQQSA